LNFGGGCSITVSRAILFVFIWTFKILIWFVCLTCIIGERIRTTRTYNACARTLNGDARVKTYSVKKIWLKFLKKKKGKENTTLGSMSVLNAYKSKCNRKFLNMRFERIHIYIYIIIISGKIVLMCTCYTERLSLRITLNHRYHNRL